MARQSTADRIFYWWHDMREDPDQYLRYTKFSAFIDLLSCSRYLKFSPESSHIFINFLQHGKSGISLDSCGTRFTLRTRFHATTIHRNKNAALQLRNFRPMFSHYTWNGGMV